MFVVGLMKMEVNGYFYHCQNVQVCIQLYSILIYVFASLVFFLYDKTMEYPLARARGSVQIMKTKCN